MKIEEVGRLYAIVEVGRREDVARSVRFLHITTIRPSPNGNVDRVQATLLYGFDPAWIRANDTFGKASLIAIPRSLLTNGLSRFDRLVREVDYGFNRFIGRAFVIGSLI